MSWLSKGDAVYQKRAEIDHLSAVKKERNVQRFWMKPDEKAVLVFLDSVPVGLK